MSKKNKTYELVNFCEFDKHASQSYCAIHNVDESLNLGDITKVDEKELEDFNMICGGSPCQDFSVAGDKKGSVWFCKECGYKYNPLEVHYSKRDYCPSCNGVDLDKSRSSLLVEWLRIIRGKNPNFGIYENVKNIVGKKFKETTFKLFENELNEYGYNTYWKVLNSSNYNVPQNRERVYLLLIKKEIDNGKFVFPKNKILSKSIDDFLDKNCKKRKVNNTLLPFFDEKYKHKYISNKGCIKVFDGECQRYFNSDYTNKRIYSKYGCCPTLTTNGNVNISELKGQLNALEFWRLMGFNDNDYIKAKSVGVSDSNLKKQAGNSIVVDVLYHIYVELYKAMPYLFEDLKVSSFFSGIGAFEKGLDRLYEYINSGNFTQPQMD